MAQWKTLCQKILEIPPNIFFYLFSNIFKIANKWEIFEQSSYNSFNIYKFKWLIWKFVDLSTMSSKNSL